MSELKVISGSGGKGGGGSGGQELPDSLRSIAVARVLDLVCEGPIGGLVDGARSIYLDETPLETVDSAGKVVRNFKGVTFDERLGTQDQSYIPEFPASESEVAVGVRVKFDTPITRAINTPGLDAVRVTVSIPSLYYQDTTSGNIYGAVATIKIAVSENGGDYVDQIIGYEWDDEVTIESNVLSIDHESQAVRLTVLGQCPLWYLLERAGSKLTYDVEYKSTEDADWTLYKSVAIEPRKAILFSRTYEITGLPFKVWSARIANVHGGTVQLTDGAFGTEWAQDSIQGKTMSKYQRSYRIALPGDGPWSIRLSRVTPDATEANVQNQTWWESYTEIVDAKFRYPNSAVIGIKADASQFSAIPKRAYDLYLREIRVPINYDPLTRTYDGIWDGTFKSAWTDNPAWCFYDLVTHERYGLGHLIDESLVDKWELYSIGQYCDELVPSGFKDSEGADIYEPRFSLNCYIQDRAEAYRVIQDLASVFRGMAYWAQGTITATQDAPTTPSALFTPANVVDGRFSYTGSAKRARHTVAFITWNDPENLCKPRVEYVEDRAGIARYGVNPISQVAFGCTSRGQAHRVGRWLLYSERYETDLVTFRSGMDGCYVRPGHVVEIADPKRMTKRLGGRVVAADAATVTVDAPVLIEEGKEYSLACILPDLTREEVQTWSAYTALSVNDGAGGDDLFYTADDEQFHLDMLDEQYLGEQTVFAAAFSTPPQPGAVWMMKVSDNQPAQFRVLSVTEPEPAVVEIVALEHNPDKYNHIEYGYQLEETPVPTPPPPYLTPPRNVTAVQELYTDELGSIRIRVIIHWEASLDNRTTAYMVRWRRGDDNWSEARTDTLMATLDNLVPGDHSCEVQSVSMEGLKSAAVAITFTVLGLTDAPPDVTGLDTKDGSGQFFGRDCELRWNSVISSAFPASLLKHYQVKILNMDDSERRTETVTGTSYTYTWEKNNSDGTVAEQFKVELRAVAINDIASTTPAQLTAAHVAASPMLTLTATGMLMSVKLGVTGILREQYQSIEIWAASVNDRSQASLVATTQDQEYLHINLPVAAVRYYWIHIIDPYGQYLDWHPLSPTGGVTGLVISDPSDLIDLLATGDPDALIIEGEIGGNPAVGINGDMIVDGTILARCIATGQLIVGDNVTMGPNATIDWSQVDNGPNVTHLDANGIYTGTLTADQVEATNFVAESANIGELSVDTLHVKNGAITNGDDAYTASSLDVTSALTTLQSLAKTTTGAPVLLDAVAYFATVSTTDVDLSVYLYRGTTIIFSATNLKIPAQGTLPVSVAKTDVPDAGSYNYYWRAQIPAGASATATCRSLRALEVKK